MNLKRRQHKLANALRSCAVYAYACLIFSLNVCPVHLQLCELLSYGRVPFILPSIARDEFWLRCFSLVHEAFKSRHKTTKTSTASDCAWCSARPTLEYTPRYDCRITHPPKRDRFDYQKFDIIHTCTTYTQAATSMGRTTIVITRPRAMCERTRDTENISNSAPSRPRFTNFQTVLPCIIPLYWYYFSCGFRRSISHWNNTIF